MKKMNKKIKNYKLKSKKILPLKNNNKFNNSNKIIIKNQKLNTLKVQRK